MCSKVNESSFLPQSLKKCESIFKDCRTQSEIIKSWSEKIDHPLVSIVCNTYNHGRYIESAIKGFLIQETDFPFEILIYDDASTDETASVIKKYENEYPALIKPLYQKENQYSLGKDVFEMNLERSKGKYIAVCEGDDYWTDCHKLQKQVCFLEEHLNYTMCFHASFIEKENEALKSNIACESIETRDYSAEEIFAKWTVPTASVVFRKDVLFMPLKRKSDFINGDIVLFLRCCECGKIFGFCDKMSVYRLNSQSVTQNWGSRIARIRKYPDFYDAVKDNFHSIPCNILEKKLSIALCERAIILPLSMRSLNDLKRAFQVSFFYSSMAICKCVMKKVKWNLLFFLKYRRKFGCI